MRHEEDSWFDLLEQRLLLPEDSQNLSATSDTAAKQASGYSRSMSSLSPQRRVGMTSNFPTIGHRCGQLRCGFNKKPVDRNLFFRPLVIAFAACSVLTVGCLGTNSKPSEQSNVMETKDTTPKVEATPSINVELNVREARGVARTNEPVTSGVPLRKVDNITDTGSLRLTQADGVTEIPAQFRVLSRFQGAPADGARPIRVVLVDYQISLSANKTETFYLQDVAATLSARVHLCAEDTGSITATTGKLTFKVSKSAFNLFDQVLIDADRDGAVDDVLVASTRRDGLRIRKDGTDYFAYNVAPGEAVIEENGPLRCVIRVRGRYRSDDGVDIRPPNVPRGGARPLTYTVRFFIYKDKQYVKVYYTHENENAGFAPSHKVGIHNIYFTSLSVRTTLAPTGTSFVTFQGHREAVGRNSFEFDQDHFEKGRNESKNFAYETRKNGRIVGKRGRRAEGWADLSHSSSGGLFMLTRWFWQQWPKAINVGGRSLDYELWDEDPSCDASTKRYEDGAQRCGVVAGENPTGEPHRMLGGSWKTHEMIYFFHAGGVDSATNPFPAVREALNHRLFALVTAEQFAQAMPLGPAGGPHVQHDVVWRGGMTLQAAHDGYDGWALAKVDTGVSGNETLETLREKRLGSWYDSGSNQGPAGGYGWEDFGDTVRATLGYHTMGLHFPYGILLNYVRLRDPRLWEEAQIMVSHKTDIDTIHNPKAARDDYLGYYTHGAHRYERFAHQDAHSSNNTHGTFGVSHAWVSSLVLYYLLTGEERYREAAERMAEHTRRWFIDRLSCDDPAPSGTSSQTCFISELRQQGRGLYILLSVYRMNGDENIWSVIRSVLYNALFPREVEQNGYFFHPGDQWDTWMLYNAVNAEALVQLWYEATSKGDAAMADDVKAFLIRNANWMVGAPARSGNGPYTTFNVGDNGTYNESGQYLPYQVGSAGWTRGVRWGDSRNFWYSYMCCADLFAWMYEIGQGNQWLDLARKVFRDALFYSRPAEQGVHYINVRTHATPSHHYFEVWIKVWPVPSSHAQAYLNIEYRLGAGVPCHADCQ